MSGVSFESNVDEILRRKDDAIDRALEAIGVQAQNHATNIAPVDTGLLKNSITYAVGGDESAVKNYTDNIGKRSGSYSGTIGKIGDESVYIATNVEYAPYV